MSHPISVGATPRDYLFPSVTPVQGSALARLVSELNPSWNHREAYAAVGLVVGHGTVAVCVAAVLAATSAGSVPSDLVFPGPHWEIARTL